MKNRHKRMADRPREMMVAPLTVQTTPGAEPNTFSGQATVFDYEFLALDPIRYEVLRTVIHPGAFTKTLRENASRIKILWHHNDKEPIGVPTALSETATALDVTGKISETRRGSDTLTLLRDGVINEMSIGFVAIKQEYEIVNEQDTVRHIREVRLDEISLVTWGANDRAQVAEVNSAWLNCDSEYVVGCFAKMIEMQPPEVAAMLVSGTLWNACRRMGEWSEADGALVRSAASAIVAGLEPVAEPPEPPGSTALTLVEVDTMLMDAELLMAQWQITGGENGKAKGTACARA